ncbi:hypothetical protein [Bradyrhizobium arachidis]|uniref:hypothetical protein n=1 Tax=Bradyrhizobium arachidis TaxID=858423 RepID=UPI00216311DF|nr:hypothetical protein [Bradyrhizobium arachidis]
MDPHNFDAFNVAAGPRVQVSQEHQPDRSGQEDFEQQLNEAREADNAIPDSGPRRSPSTNVSSDTQQSPAEPMSALARRNLLPSEVLISDEHDTAELRAAKRPRVLNNPQGVAIEQQLSEIANSGGGGAMPAASAVQPAQSTGIVVRGHQLDKRPVYSEDAPEILRLEEALIKGGMVAGGAKQHAGALLSFSRWLFAKRRPSVVARLDSKSLSNSGDVYEFVGKGNPKNLLVALDHLRTFRSTGEVVVRQRSGRAKVNPRPLNVAPIHPESAVLMEPTLIGDAAAQHRASHEASSRREELRDGQEDQPAPSAFVQGHVAINPEQLHQWELRQVLDHLDHQPIPSPVYVPSEELQRLEKDLQDELHRQPAASFSADPEGFSFDLEQFSPGELRRLLDDQSIPSPVSVPSEEFQRLEQDLQDELHRHPAASFSADPEWFSFDLEQFSPGELRGLLDDQSIPSPVSVPSEEFQRLEQDLQDELYRHPAASFSADPEWFSFDLEQFSPGELRRLLDDQSIPSPVSVPSEEFQRLEKDLQDELHRHPAPSFSADPEEFSFDLEQFSPGELRRLLDDQSIPSPVSVDPEDSALNLGQSDLPRKSGRV